MVENHIPKNTIDLLKNYSTKQPFDVAQYVARRVTGTFCTVSADIGTGSSMKVVLPEWISSVIKFTGDYEPEVTESMKMTLKKGMSFWDIGAHVGLRMVQGNDLVGKEGYIYAFEPTPRTKNILDINSSNRTASITTSPFALGDMTAEVDFRDFGWMFSGCNTTTEVPRTPTKKLLKPPKPAIINCPITTVDNLVMKCNFRPPDVMVIDAEGMEINVINGAKETINKHQPVIIFEAGDLGCSKTIPTINLLNSFGYNVFEINKGKFEQHKMKLNYPDPINLIAFHPHACRRVLI